MSVILNESSEQITVRDQLVKYFSSSAKPKAEWLIGCEHEKFPYRLSTLAPVSYNEPNGIRDLLNELQNYGWKPVIESGNIIGLSRGRTAISLEPGGQLELAGAPLSTLHETAAETDQHLTEVCDIGERLDIGFMGIGFHPTAKRDEIPWMPKGRYQIMRDYMPKRGKAGLDMMLRTCTVQVNLDYSDEADMAKKFRVALALQPVATALFASSPFKESQSSGFLSTRMHIWTDTDPDRTGTLPFVFDDDFGYERYTDYALDVPMYFIYRNGHYIDCAGQSFRAFMEGKLPALPGELPTLSDWGNHLTTLFPDVRLKRVLEMRGADAGTTEMMQALPSFWVGLLYDTVALDSAWDMIKNWSKEDMARLHAEAPRLGFNAEVRGKKVRDIAQLSITVAQHGLRRRVNRLHGAVDEARYLDILLDFVESGQSRADQMLMQQKHFQEFNMNKVFEICRLHPSLTQHKEKGF